MGRYRVPRLLSAGVAFFALAPAWASDDLPSSRVQPTATKKGDEPANAAPAFEPPKREPANAAFKPAKGEQGNLAPVPNPATKDRATTTRPRATRRPPAATPERPTPSVRLQWPELWRVRVGHVDPGGQIAVRGPLVVGATWGDQNKKKPTN
jgi:hypothetical protein